MLDGRSLPVEAEIFRRLAAMTAEGEPGVLATVISAAGSTPRHEGSRMIVLADGTSVGSVGGGQAEAEVMAAAAEVMVEGKCRRIHLDLAGGLRRCPRWLAMRAPVLNCHRQNLRPE